MWIRHYRIINDCDCIFCCLYPKREVRVGLVEDGPLHKMLEPLLKSLAEREVNKPMPKAKKSTADLASLLLAIGQACHDAVADSGLLVRPKATRAKKGAKRKRRTKAEMAAARAAQRKPAKPVSKQKPALKDEPETEEEED